MMPLSWDTDKLPQNAHGIPNKVVELRGHDIALVFYDIDEFGMGAEHGRLAILENKGCPRLVLRSDVYFLLTSAMHGVVLLNLSGSEVAALCVGGFYSMDNKTKANPFIFIRFPSREWAMYPLSDGWRYVPSVSDSNELVLRLQRKESYLPPTERSTHRRVRVALASAFEVSVE